MGVTSANLRAIGSLNAGLFDKRAVGGHLYLYKSPRPLLASTDQAYQGSFTHAVRGTGRRNVGW